MKKCPYCAEEIQDEAIKCRYCGEFLNQSTSVPTKAPSPVTAVEVSEKPLLSTILSSHNAGGSSLRGNMSEAELARLLNPLGKNSEGAFFVSMKAGQALGQSFGLKSTKSIEKTYFGNYPETVIAIVLAIKSSGSELLNMLDVDHGCMIESRMPSDLFSLDGNLRFVIYFQDGQETKVTATSEIGGQMFDWGKGQRALTTVLEKAQSYIQLNGK